MLFTLQLGGVADAQLIMYTHFTRWELMSSSPLRIAAIQTIDTSSMIF